MTQGHLSLEAALTNKGYPVSLGSVADEKVVGCVEFTNWLDITRRYEVDPEGIVARIEEAVKELATPEVRTFLEKLDGISHEYGIHIWGSACRETADGGKAAQNLDIGWDYNVSKHTIRLALD